MFSVEEECTDFKVGVIDCVRDTFGVRGLGKRRIKRNEWCGDEIRKMISRKSNKEWEIKLYKNGINGRN